MGSKIQGLGFRVSIDLLLDPPLLRGRLSLRPLRHHVRPDRAGILLQVLGRVGDTEGVLRELGEQTRGEMAPLLIFFGRYGDEGTPRAYG